MTASDSGPDDEPGHESARLQPDWDRVLMQASGRLTVAEAVLWFSEGHPVLDESPLQTVMAASLAQPADTPQVDEALRELVRQAAASTLDPSSVLFKIEAIHPPSSIRACLDNLASHSPTKDLTGANALLRRRSSCR